MDVLSPAVLLYAAEILTFTILGLVLGSFSTALIYRTPRRMAWGLSSKQRSTCPHCRTPLGVKDLFPVLSCLLQKGQCRYCGEEISRTYLRAELLCVAMTLVLYLSYGWSVETFLLAGAIPFLAALLFIDLKHMILPNPLIMALGLTALLFHAYRYSLGALVPVEFLTNYAIGALLYGGLALTTGRLMTRLLKKEALGMGDTKFFTVAGLWLGIAKLPLFCILSGVLGVMLGLGWKIIRKTETFPFGPALIGGLFCLLLLQDGTSFADIYFLFSKFGYN